MNRKAITTEGALITVIVFAMVMIIAAILANTLFAVGKSQFTEAQCRASLLLTQAVGKPQKCEISVPNPVPIQCNRDFVTTTKTAATRDGKDVTGAYNAICPSDKTASAGTASATALAGTASCLSSNVVAEEMRTCWREFLEGNTPVLQQLETDDYNFLGRVKNAVTGTNRACFVCAEVTLKDDGAVQDLNTYLKNAQITVGNQQMSYYDYLVPKLICNPNLIKTDPNDPNNPKTANCYEGLALSRNPPINHKKLDVGTTYAVVFVRQGLTSCANTETSNDRTVTQTVQVIPAKDIATQCDLVTV